MSATTKKDNPYPSTQLGDYCQTITCTLPGKERWRAAYFGFDYWRLAVPTVDFIKSIRPSLTCLARPAERLTVPKFEVKVTGDPTRDEVKQIYLELIQSKNPSAPLPWVVQALQKLETGDWE